MAATRRQARAVLLAGVLACTAACAEPPQKELDRAHGAIETARAAGAEQYAADVLRAAEDARTGADAAVRDRDYRLALDRALAAYERAREAARVAGEARAEARGSAERALAELETLLGNARWRLKDAPVQRLAPRALSAPRATVDHAERALQDARSAFGRDDYRAATAAIDGQAAQVQAAMTALDQALAASPARRRR